MKRCPDFRRCRQLFLAFLKIGTFTFGGGYAMIPLIKRETVDKEHWIEEEDILEIVAVAESTPGPIAVNSATFVGYHVAGPFGAFCATVGVVLPSFFIILILSYFLRQFESLQVVQFAFNGIRTGVLALIVGALVSMGRQCPKNILSYCIAAVAFAAVAFFGANVLIIILCSALVGLAYSMIARKGGESK